MKKVKIYSTPTCVYCNLAKDYFTKNNIPFDNFDVSVDLDKRKEMIDKSQQMGVPVIDIEGKIIVGFDQIQIAKELGI